MFEHKNSHNLLQARVAKKKQAAWAKPAKKTGFYVGVVAAVFGLIIVPFLIIGVLIFTHADKGRDALNAAVREVNGLNIDAAIVQADIAADEFAAAQQELGKLVLFRYIPYLDDRLDAADRLLATGSVTIGALKDLLGVVRDVVKVIGEGQNISATLDGSIPSAALLFQDLTPAQKRDLLASLSRNAPAIRSALGKIDTAQSSLQELGKSEAMAPFQNILAPLQSKLLKLRDGLSAILPVSEALPSILGFPDGKNYLIFLQNDTELRPTGGFLGVYALAKVKDADLVSLTSDDIYVLDAPFETRGDRPPAPAPITKYIGLKQWYLRDANWSPDFPTSAATMVKFFNEEAAVARPEQNVPIDGIIAFSTKPASDLLRITGPITVDGIKFDADNLVDELEFQVEVAFAQQGIDRGDRKDIVGKLMQEIVERLKGMSVANLIRVAGVVQDNLAEGHILLSMQDASLQRAILEHNWGGKMLPVNGDYLSIIDANLAALKTDPVMRRNITYTIAPEGEGYVAKAAITYQNTGKFDWKTTRYRTYTRVYVPAGSVLIGSSGAMENDKLKDPKRRPGTVDVLTELGRTAFGAFISIEPGEKKTLEFTYKLPPAVASAIKAGRYSLDVEKQLGTLGHGLTLDLDFGKKLSSAEPAEAQQNWGNGQYNYSTDLRTDKRFDVSF